MTESDFLACTEAYEVALRLATRAGVLDRLQGDMANPDDINRVCDGVGEMLKAMKMVG